jgi:sarcosine oxidase delta subunit
MMYENASFLAQKSSHFSYCGFSRSCDEYAKCGFANISSPAPLASFIKVFFFFYRFYRQNRRRLPDKK